MLGRKRLADDDDDDDVVASAEAKRRRSRATDKGKGRLLSDDEDEEGQEMNMFDEVGDEDKDVEMEELDSDDSDDDNEELGDDADGHAGSLLDPNAKSEAEVGILRRVVVKNFMCHRYLEVNFGPNMNFITGLNGSGKSAVLTAIMVGLGAKVAATNRARTYKELIMKGKETAVIEISLLNQVITVPDASLVCSHRQRER